MTRISDTYTLQNDIFTQSKTQARTHTSTHNYAVKM